MIDKLEEMFFADGWMKHTELISNCEYITWEKNGFVINDEDIQDTRNPAHFCLCGKFLGHRGFCGQKCHDTFYSGFSAKEILE